MNTDTSFASASSEGTGFAAAGLVGDSFASERLTLRSAQLLALGKVIRTESFNRMDSATRANIALLIHDLTGEINKLIPIALDESCPERICRSLSR